GRLPPRSRQDGRWPRRVGARSRGRSERKVVAGSPLRGEVWMVDLRPARGHEQDLWRPAVIISSDGFNRSAAELVMLLPITRTFRGITSPIHGDPPEGW